MNVTIGTLPDGTRGFDCNARVGPELAKRFFAHGYRFAVRYVRRATRHDYDISIGEIASLLGAGLGLMLVQHVAPDGWHPSRQLGVNYGTIAADEALRVGYPLGATLWCDLEGVAPGVPAAEVIDFCNSWWTEVGIAGYTPGLYVGYGAGLSATQLYRNLKFANYWGAYNLNADSVPIVRGLQMRQYAPKAADKVPGCPFEIDVNVIKTDAKNATPLLVLPQ